MRDSLRSKLREELLRAIDYGEHMSNDKQMRSMGKPSQPTLDEFLDLQLDNVAGILAFEQYVHVLQTIAPGDYVGDGNFRGMPNPMKDGMSPTIVLENIMTGQEFYDRFKLGFVNDGRMWYSGDMLALVRRAAGIE